MPPVPDTLLRPLLANCLYLLETIGPHLVAEQRVSLGQVVPIDTPDDAEVIRQNGSQDPPP